MKTLSNVTKYLGYINIQLNSLLHIEMRYIVNLVNNSIYRRRRRKSKRYKYCLKHLFSFQNNNATK